VYTSPANDWLHGNCAQVQLADGSLVVSLRNQDWVIKIDFGYPNGNGTQNIKWRLGLGGDFTINSNVQFPWFSGQHDAEFQGTQVAGGPLATVMTVLDDGNTRVAQGGPGSRGAAYTVNEATMTASFYAEAGLTVFTHALGSAQQLPNKNYWYDAGWVVGPGNTFYEESSEYTPNGTLVYLVKAPATAYRSWRMPSMYSLSGTYEP
jgi:hypothetical protein